MVKGLWTACIAVIIGFVAIVAASVSSCNQKSSSFKRSPQDTMPVLGMYLAADVNDVRGGIMKRVTLDTFKYVDTDTITKKKMWVRDSFYLITYYVQADSFAARRYGVPLKDSTGKPTIIPIEIATDKKYVRSGWGGVDSIAIAQLKAVK